MDELLIVYRRRLEVSRNYLANSDGKDYKSIVYHRALIQAYEEVVFDLEYLQKD